MPFLFCGGGGMVDAYVWGAYGFNGREGSSPFLRTTKIQRFDTIGIRPFFIWRK